MSDLTFPKKWSDKLPAGFKDAAESMQTEELKSKLIEVQKDIAQTEKDMEVDEKLNDAKELVKELRSTYTFTINECKAITKYILYVLEGRGQ